MGSLCAGSCLSVARGLQSAQASWCGVCLENVCSVVAVHGLHCPTACGILVPQSGIKPISPALEGRFLTTGPPRKSLFLFLEAYIMVNFPLRAAFAASHRFLIDYCLSLSSVAM